MQMHELLRAGVAEFAAAKRARNVRLALGLLF
jgi:hypothetical protein